jgi:hypothetical protein
MSKGSSAEYLDEQIARLVETIDAGARTQDVPERDGGVTERPEPPADEQPRLIRSPGATVPRRLLRRFRWRWHQVRSDAAFILVGAAVGLVLGALFGR